MMSELEYEEMRLAEHAAHWDSLIVAFAVGVMLGMLVQPWL